MCIVSMIGDNYRDNFKLTDKYRWLPPYHDTAADGRAAGPENPYAKIVLESLKKNATNNEIEALREELSELRKLLKAAKIYDEKTGQKNCEMKEKVEFIKKMAEYLGVDMEDVFDQN